MASKTVRWMPALVVPVVIVSGALVLPLTANAASDLPDKTPQEVLALVGESSVTALSGTVEQTSKLGLPELPATDPSNKPGLSSGSAMDAASLLELLTGSHRARVYLNGPDQAHVQILDQLAERDMIRNGSDVWLWDSSDRAATHVTLPAPGQRGSAEPQDSQAPAEAQTPAQLAKRLLAAVDPSTTVAVGADTRVAGRAAYTLLLDPRSSTTLVDSVSIAVDAETGLPLSVAVNARGQKDPAFELAFTALSLEKPAESRFSFTPPKGATVTEQTLPTGPGTGDAPAEHQAGALPEPTVIGTGWDAVAALPAGSVPPELTASPLFGQLTESVDGGRLLSTSLLTVLITDDGRVFAGAVPVQALRDASAGR
ncbi:LolA family protein [Glaciibacter sp. 2TAF33]|uniref:LolA family protein n=1 Tax=Glaciibacter sp. 2TAF33 TaxID=3233015 RepID=UPI003F8E00C9